MPPLVDSSRQKGLNPHEGLAVFWYGTDCTRSGSNKSGALRNGYVHDGAVPSLRLRLIVQWHPSYDGSTKK